MSPASQTSLHVAIACGGTGGHLFPGLAVAEQLARRNCAVTLLISPKEVDQQAVKAATGLRVLTLPAVGLVRGRVFSFLRGFAASYRLAMREFKSCPPQAALAMGGFTSAPPLLAAKRLGARTFLHESNTIPGRANRWLARLVAHAFVGFPCTASRLRNRRITVTGTPVRRGFQPGDPSHARVQLGFDAASPLVLVMGGSQGATGINHLVMQALPGLARTRPGWQWLHLTGPTDAQKVSAAYDQLKLKASVHPFFGAMELALSAAGVAVSRAGASSLAEMAALRLPSILVPYPAATDNHQYFNARAFEETGAACLLPQAGASGERLAQLLTKLVEDVTARSSMQSALAQWHKPRAAEEIAETIVAEAARGRHPLPGRKPGAAPDSGALLLNRREV